MKFSYKFSNLLGAIYRGGNLLFASDGNSIISPVGNRLAVYDLKNNVSRALNFASKYNYHSIGLSPDGSLLIAVDESGETQLISMVSCTVIQTHKFLTVAQCVQFSPDGQHFAIAMKNVVFIFKTPGEISGEYNPFKVERTFLGGYDDITWLDWSTDSRFIAVGCRDNTTKVIGLSFVKKFRTYTLGGHTEGIVACFFEENCLDMITISRNGQMCVWKCSLALSELLDKQDEYEPKELKRRKEVSKEDIDSENEKREESEKRLANVEDLCKSLVDENEINDKDAKKGHPFFYIKLARHYLANEPRKDDQRAFLSAASYHRNTKILVVAFSTGSFYLFEMPAVSVIHSLNISDYTITSLLFNNTGDWLALSSKEMGQLLVWEWQSEQYIMKQQGHSSEMTCVCYSPDGQYIATGGQDAKVKLWNTQTGFCYITFSEHTSGITAVQFSQNKKFLVSSSLDGTVRAFDITRYRNFRTFTSSRHVQFSCVDIDYSGEFVVAGGQDVFEIHLWSMKFGKLLEVLSGHEGPISAVAFSPVATSTTLVTGSWDKTIKIWNCLLSNNGHETIDLCSDVSNLTFSPNGTEIAVCTLNGNVTIFDMRTSTQIGTIQGRYDLGSGRSETDVITAKRNLLGKYFTTIEFSADGKCILAGGQSKFVCIYDVHEAILLKKFEISQNHSLMGLDEYVNRRHISEFGNLALIEKREIMEGGNIAIRLPGVRKGKLASRNHKLEIKVFDVKFAPTGQSFAVACTEGLCIYSLDKGIVFDPFELSMEITPKAVMQSLKTDEYLKALMMSLKLNENNLILLVLEKISYKDVELVCSSLPNDFANRLLHIIARILQSTVHVEFYIRWSCCLLTSHGNKEEALKGPTMLAVHDSLLRKYESLNRICDFNKYTMKVILRTFADRCASI